MGLPFSLVLILSISLALADEVAHLEVIGKSDCKRTEAFVHGQLQDAWTPFGPSGLLSITYIPHSFCKNSEGDSLECADEVSSLQACAMDAFPNSLDHLNFIACSLRKKTIENVLNHCPLESRVNLSRLTDCASGMEGSRLLGRYAKSIQRDTNSSHHFGVPVVVINGKWEKEAVHSLERLLCGEYLKTTEMCSRNN